MRLSPDAGTGPGSERERLLLRVLAKRELERRKKEEALRYYRPHEKQRIIHSSLKRLKAAMGGNRTGKSVCGAVEDVLFALGRDAGPYIEEWEDQDKSWWHARFAHLQGGQRIWCATESWDVQRDVMQENLLRYIPKPILDRCSFGWRKKGVLDFIDFPNGSRITFKSYETGWKGFQGASVDFIHLDEEPPYDIWNECEKRVMDRKGTILLTFTPLNGLTWAHGRLYLNESNDPEVMHVLMSWDDNPYLDEGEKRRLLASMSEDEIQARVYGRFLVMGGTVFRAQNLLDRLERIKSEPPPRRYRWNGTQFTRARRDGTLLVWEEPKPHRRYVIGVDTAEGLPEGDNSVAQVLDVETGVQVAELCTREEPVPFAAMVAALGHRYNTAFLIPERNNDGKALLAALEEIHLYPNLYRHPDDKRYGWPETAKTRPLLIAEGQDMVRDHPETIRSEALIQECLTFVRNARGRPQAAGKGTRGGKKDDRVIAWMLALIGRNYFLTPVADPVVPKSKPVKAASATTVFDDGDMDDPQGDYARFDPSLFV